jgi:hypothetical protein
MSTFRTLAVAVGLAALAISTHAGAQQRLLDKLNNAAKKVQESAKQPATQPVARGADGAVYTGQGGATDLSGLEKHNECFKPLDGYRAKITADKLEAKLGSQTGLTAEQHAAWEQDIAAVRATQAAGSDQMKSPPPADPNRYLSHLTTAEQTQLNGEFSTFYNQTMSGCQGRDVMNVGHTTPMNYVKDTTAADAQRAAQDKQTEDSMACIKSASGLRWQVMADKLQAKMGTLTLTAAERTAWEQDIAVLRQPQTGAATMPMSPDPQNPMRYMTRLSPEEQVAMNTEVGERTSTAMQQCTSNQRVVERPIQAGGLVDKSKSPANKNAQPTSRERPASTRNAQGGALGAGNVTGLVEYNECYEPLRGHLAKVTAEALEAKLATQTSLSAQQRGQWQEDIASWRAAEAEGKDSATPADADNPYRWQDWLTRDERAQINGKHAAFNNQIVRDCGARDSGIGSGGKKK